MVNDVGRNVALHVPLWATLALCAALAGCETDPEVNDAGARDAAMADAAMSDAGVIDPPRCEGLAASPPVRMCEALDTDYAPGVDDMWAACVSDDGEYHRVVEDISTIARVAAYDELAAAIFDPTRDPTPDELLAARLIYQREEGLDSRVVRRYDPHFTVPDGTDCALPGVPEAFPDYCVGPARLAPLILEAFQGGVEGDGELPRVHAARIEAALQWFLAVSTYKESLTCTETPKDCDSSYAYYTGGEPARGGIGLSALVAAADPAAHDRAWDGLLAVRCWRDLDPAEPATDLALRDRARAQYDRAVLDGVAALLRQRLVQLCASEGAELLAHWAYAQTLGGLLDRELRARDAVGADVVAAELARSRPGDADVPAIVDALDAAFDCP